MKYKNCYICDLTWNVSKFLDDHKLYVCPKCEIKMKRRKKIDKNNFEQIAGF